MVVETPFLRSAKSLIHSPRYGWAAFILIGIQQAIFLTIKWDQTLEKTASFLCKNIHPNILWQA